MDSVDPVPDTAVGFPVPYPENKGHEAHTQQDLSQRRATRATLQENSVEHAETVQVGLVLFFVGFLAGAVSSAWRLELVMRKRT